MKFWIVTPSYNQLEWLKMCVASVADQATDGMEHGAERIEVCHHIQDACSVDGTPEWLAECIAQKPPTMNYQLSFASEADNGMYDAINRGWKLAPDDVDVIAHLNCDEQYLPDTLEAIAGFFNAHQETDVVLADMIVVDADGSYICHRRSLKPYAFTSRFCCGGFTATTFQRASVTKDKKVFFDTSWRNFGDKVWYNALHQAGCRFEVCNQMVAAFADTGANLNWTEEGLRERRLYEEKYLGGSRVGTLLVAKSLGLRRAIKELFIKPPASYAMFLSENDNRVTMPITNPKGLWNKKWKKSRQ